MIKKLFAFFLMIPMVFIFFSMIENYKPITKLGTISEKYVKEGPNELGIPNLITGVVVTYRGLDTLGEVTVLFIATAGVGFLLGNRKKEETEGDNDERRSASELIQSGSSFLMPFIFLFGVYIFVHGHLTPGGGFQGGVVIASGILFSMLAKPDSQINETILQAIESLSGAAFVAMAILGLILAGGFLDNRFLPLGEYGKLFSGGAIPIIYSLIGLKVGSELTGILESMSGNHAPRSQK